MDRGIAEEMAEKVLGRVVALMKAITSWPAVLIWSFLVPLLMGQHILFCMLSCAVFTYFAYVLWRETDLDSTGEQHGQE